MAYLEKLTSDDSVVEIEIYEPKNYRFTYKVVIKANVSYIEIEESEIKNTISALKLARRRIRKDRKNNGSK
jgi:hypothetical protein